MEEEITLNVVVWRVTIPTLTFVVKDQFNQLTGCLNLVVVVEMLMTKQLKPVVLKFCTETLWRPSLVVVEPRFITSTLKPVALDQSLERQKCMT